VGFLLLASPSEELGNAVARQLGGQELGNLERGNAGLGAGMAAQIFLVLPVTHGAAMTEHIQFLRALIGELRNQRDDARENAIELSMDNMRLRARVRWLENELETRDAAIDKSVALLESDFITSAMLNLNDIVLRRVDTGPSQADRKW
jgi:hypothetical protein